MPFRLLLAMGVLLLAGAGYVLVSKLGHGSGETAPRNVADPNLAHNLLIRLARCQWAYSAETGGGGKGGFTTDIARLLNVNPIPDPERHRKIIVDDYPLYLAFDGTPGHTPHEGWVFRLEENPVGDQYRTNFRFVARPAEGLTGPTLTVDKTENPQIQKADEH